MKTLGVDLAAQPERTGVCLVDWTSRPARVHPRPDACENAKLPAVFEAADKIGLDVPLGWPDAFVAFVLAHHDHQPLPSGERQLRETDRWVQAQLGLRPLSVSSDRIAVPAMRAAQLLAKYDVDRGGHGRFVEVYPAAALKRWGLPHRSYKRRDQRVVREEILAALARDWLDLAAARAQLLDSDHLRRASLRARRASGRARSLRSAPPRARRACVARRLDRCATAWPLRGARAVSLRPLSSSTL